MRRLAAFGGIAAFVIFWAATIVFGTLRPEYSHFINTISELGAIGTPNAILWNVIGFIIPGILLAIAGGAIAQSVGGQRSLAVNIASVLLVITGVAVAGQGIIPAEMTNGVADAASSSTRGHFISSLLSGAAWVVGALLLVKPMKQDPDWHGWHLISIVLVIVVLVASFTLRNVLPDGLAQRVGNIFFFGWFLLMSAKLIQLERDGEKARVA